MHGSAHMQTRSIQFNFIHISSTTCSTPLPSPLHTFRIKAKCLNLCLIQYKCIGECTRKCVLLIFVALQNIRLLINDNIQQMLKHKSKKNRFENKIKKIL